MDLDSTLDAIEAPTPDECPQRQAHTPGPKGYLEWHSWAERQAAKNVQVLCPGGCGGLVWTPTDDLCGRCQHPTEHHEGPGSPCLIEDCDCTRWTRRIDPRRSR